MKTFKLTYQEHAMGWKDEEAIGMPTSVYKKFESIEDAVTYEILGQEGGIEKMYEVNDEMRKDFEEGFKEYMTALKEENGWWYDEYHEGFKLASRPVPEDSYSKKGTWVSIEEISDSAQLQSFRLKEMQLKRDLADVQEQINYVESGLEPPRTTIRVYELYYEDGKASEDNIDEETGEDYFEEWDEFRNLSHCLQELFLEEISEDYGHEMANEFMERVLTKGEAIVDADYKLIDTIEESGECHVLKFKEIKK